MSQILSITVKQRFSSNNYGSIKFNLFVIFIEFVVNISTKCIIMCVHSPVQCILIAELTVATPIYEDFLAAPV